MSWLDAFLTAIGFAQDNGTALPQRNTLNFIGATVTDDPTTKTTNVTIPTGAPGTAISARVVATTNITLSGSQTIDGVSVGAGDVALVAGQTSAAENGLWTAASGVWTRTADQIVSGMLVYIQEGTSFKGAIFVLITPDPISLNSTPLSFIKQANYYNVQIFGADPTGAASSTAAIQAAHDALPATGGTLEFPDGTYTSGALTFSKPVRVLLNRATITFTASPGITATYNLRIEGQKQTQAVLVGASGGTILKLAAGWNGYPGITFVEGGPALFIAHLTFFGGARHIDASTLTGFYEGDFHVENTVFYQSTGMSVELADSVYYGRLTRCQWVQCYGCAQIGAFCETKFTHCIFKQSTSGGPGVILLESHHTEFQFCQHYGAPPNVNPDILLQPVHQDTAGYCLLDRCKFGPEREYWLRKNRHRVELLDPDGGNLRFGMQAVRIRFCEFLGPPSLTISLIGRISNVSTATIASPNSSGGHGLQAGDRFHVIFCADSSFNGEWIVASVPTLTTLTFTNAGSDVNPPSAFSGNAGLVASSELSAVAFLSPPNDWVFEENHFENYAYAVDDEFDEQAGALDHSARCVWGASNYMTGSVSTQCQEFKLGGHNFMHFLPGPTSPAYPLDSRDRERETPEIRNRIAKSQTIDTWAGNVGPLTLTAGQADPWGGTAATKVARIGAAPVVTDAGDNVYSVTEAIVSAFDQTGLPDTCFLSFWAKAGSTRSLWVGIIDGAGALHFQQVFNLSSAWKRYKVPVTWNPGGGFVFEVIFSPGLSWAMFGDCYLVGVQLSDFDSDYYPTAATALADTTVGLRLTRTAMIGALAASDLVTTDASKRLASLAGGDISVGTISAHAVKAAGSAPSVADASGDVPNTIGTGGTFGVVTGSVDMAGTVKINTGTGPGGYTIFDVTFSGSLPGNKPVVQLALEDSGASWGGGTLTRLSVPYLVFVGNSFFRVLVINQNGSGAGGLTQTVAFTASTSDAYRINYTVVQT